MKTKVGKENGNNYFNIRQMDFKPKMVIADKNALHNVKGVNLSRI